MEERISGTESCRRVERIMPLDVGQSNNYLQTGYSYRNIKKLFTYAALYTIDAGYNVDRHQITEELVLFLLEVKNQVNVADTIIRGREATEIAPFTRMSEEEIRNQLRPVFDRVRNHMREQRFNVDKYVLRNCLPLLAFATAPIFAGALRPYNIIAGRVAHVNIIAHERMRGGERGLLVPNPEAPAVAGGDAEDDPGYGPLPVVDDDTDDPYDAINELLPTEAYEEPTEPKFVEQVEINWNAVRGDFIEMKALSRDMRFYNTFMPAQYGGLYRTLVPSFMTEEPESKEVFKRFLSFNNHNLKDLRIDNSSEYATALYSIALCMILKLDPLPPDVRQRFQRTQFFNLPGVLRQEHLYLEDFNAPDELYNLLIIYNYVQDTNALSSYKHDYFLDVEFVNDVEIVYQQKLDGMKEFLRHLYDGFAENDLIVEFGIGETLTELGNFENFWTRYILKNIKAAINFGMMAVQKYYLDHVDDTNCRAYAFHSVFRDENSGAPPDKLLNCARVNKSRIDSTLLYLQSGGNVIMGQRHTVDLQVNKVAPGELYLNLRSNGTLYLRISPSGLVNVLRGDTTIQDFPEFADIKEDLFEGEGVYNEIKIAILLFGGYGHAFFIDEHVINAEKAQLGRIREAKSRKHAKNLAEKINKTANALQDAQITQGVHRLHKQKAQSKSGR
jgi:hypothetical protein